MPASPVAPRLLRPTPLVVVAAAAAIALATAPSPAPANVLVGDCVPGASWHPARADLAAAVIKLVNAHRVSLNLRPLALSAALTRSAVWKAQHMATYRYMGHDDPAPPVARTVGERIAACGYSGAWGENIAEGYPTAASVVAGWLGSPGHRANIENPSYTVTGSGAAVASGGITLWAQDFGTGDDSGATGGGGARSTGGGAEQGIVLRNLRLAPHRPVTGGRLVASVGAFGAPSLKPLAHASVTCRGFSGTTPLALVGHGFHTGVATCAWRVAGSGLVSASIVVSSAGHAATATFKTFPR